MLGTGLAYTASSSMLGGSNVMASHAPQPSHPVDDDTLAEADDERIAAFDEAADAEAAMPGQTWAPDHRPKFHVAAEAGPPYAMLAGCAAAVLIGGGVGYWLGARCTHQPARNIRRAASRAENAVELLPVAMHLLANPVVRALAIKMLMRRLGH